eukprot:TRINITY_DN43625_c0_g2_i1.p1 TRINITY_DN43625_c0_g2~~TRINITY_DN43625_c0_g2_i1.p1  ORF type:complete len:483 (-),score=84.48 TRINITY_DN43625_c0_g2_i1:181-1629(-)
MWGSARRRLRDQRRKQQGHRGTSKYGQVQRKTVQDQFGVTYDVSPPWFTHHCSCEQLQQLENARLTSTHRSDFKGPGSDDLRAAMEEPEAHPDAQHSTSPKARKRFLTRSTTQEAYVHDLGTFEEVEQAKRREAGRLLKASEGGGGGDPGKKLAGLSSRAAGRQAFGQGRSHIHGGAGGQWWKDMADNEYGPGGQRSASSGKSDNKDKQPAAGLSVHEHILKSCSPGGELIAEHEAKQEIHGGRQPQWASRSWSQPHKTFPGSPQTPVSARSCDSRTRSIERRGRSSDARLGSRDALASARSTGSRARSEDVSRERKQVPARQRQRARPGEAMDPVPQSSAAGEENWATPPSAAQDSYRSPKTNERIDERRRREAAKSLTDKQARQERLATQLRVHDWIEHNAKFYQGTSAAHASYRRPPDGAWAEAANASRQGWQQRTETLSAKTSPVQRFEFDGQKYGVTHAPYRRPEEHILYSRRRPVM